MGQRRQRRAPRARRRLGPGLGTRLVQVLDRERLVVEREAELRGDERQPVPRVRARICVEAVVQPAAVLLHLAGDLAAAVARAQRLEAAGGAREGADGEVPAGVGAHERAAVHHAAVARGPGQHRHERDGARASAPDRGGATRCAARHGRQRRARGTARRAAPAGAPAPPRPSTSAPATSPASRVARRARRARTPGA